MPELPEVETIRRDLRPSLLGKRFSQVELRWPKAVREPEPGVFTATLVGKTILDVTRRGKYLIFQLSDGLSLLIHLMMSGALFLRPPGETAGQHVHTIFTFADGTQLHFRDQRKFGDLWLVQNPTLVLRKLGPEPLADDFGLDDFQGQLVRHHRSLKPLLLDQTFLAGLGNIYADEALFEAGLHPLRQANTLSEAEAQALYRAIRRVLRRAMAHRGTTFRDYRDGRGQEGRHQAKLKVFRRTGLPCPRCGTPIQRMTLHGRGTHFCPHCQR